MIRNGNALQIGAAEIDITPAPGLPVLGQMHNRIGRCVHDPLTANAIAFRQGRETVVLVSVDISLLTDDFVRRVQGRFARRARLPATRLLLHATHTHVAPPVVTLLATKADPAFIARLEKAIVDVALTALSKLETSRVFSGSGETEHMGWNRRAMFDDGTSRMYGNSTQPGFVGMEGPRDPAVNVLCVRDRKDRVRAVVANFSSHPNCLEDGWFYSADIPGAVRKVLKGLFGSEVVVVYLTGAAGNTAPSVLDPHDPKQPWRGEAGLARSGTYLGGEIAKVIASAVHPNKSPELRLAQETLRVPIRPWPERGKPSWPLALDPKNRWKSAFAYYKKAKAEWPRRLSRLSPVSVRLNIIRIGDTAICTNPAELFVEFGLEIRAASPAKVTMVSELTDGYVGYVPTTLAFQRGGYETWAAPTSQLVPEAGAQLVQSTRTLLDRAFARR